MSVHLQTMGVPLHPRLHKSFSSDHQVIGASYDKVGVCFNDPILHAPFLNFVEVHGLRLSFTLWYRIEN